MSMTDAQRQAAQKQLQHEQAVKDTLKKTPVNGGESVSSDPVEAARSRVLSLHCAEIEWSDKYLAAAADVDNEGLASGVLVLQSPGKLEHLAQMRAEKIAARDISAQAIDAARLQRREAIADLYKVEAGALTSQATGLRAEADQRQATADRLLAELREYEGCDFEPRHWQEPNAIGTLSDHQMIPKTNLLRRQASDLERQAATSAARPVRDAGAINATTRDELVDLVRRYDALVIAPSVPAVMDWITPREAAITAKRSGRALNEVAYQPVDAPLAITLTWQSGSIDVTRSTVSEPVDHRPMQKVDGQWMPLYVAD